MAGTTHHFLPGIRAHADVEYLQADSGTVERWRPLHLAQSQLDSACGLHALCMALMVLTGIRRSQVESMARATRGPFRELWQLATVHFFEGVQPDDLVGYLQPFADQLAGEAWTSKSRRRVGQAVQQAISAGAVPLLQIDSRAWSHFVAVVGFERECRALPTALLVLDPSHPAPWLTPFNGRLDLTGGGGGGKAVRTSKAHPLPYRVLDGHAWAVQLRGLVIVRRTDPPP